MSDARWISYGMMATVGVVVIIYQKPIVPDCAIYETIGAVRLSDDGTWCWWRWSSRFFPEWEDGKGMELTEKDAEDRVLEGWL